VLGTDAVDRDGAMVDHLLRQLAGQLHRLDGGSERPAEDAFDHAADLPLDVPEYAHGS
jgi:hypothetical protein